MKTVVKDWYIVSVLDDDVLVGKVLYGIVVDDLSVRFLKDDFVSTSPIVKINLEAQLIQTQTGSYYQTLGCGQSAEIQIKDFELLRHGFNPEQINQLNLSPNDYFH
tara:strand:+ start:35080 stop:35397 length:318 start_codon:yes stop_codon:yes gene_type:complete